MKRKVFSIVASLLVLLSFLAPTASASDAPLANASPVYASVSAESYCLMDGDTGDVLASSNENVKMPIASTTKILTCIVALESAHPEDEVCIAKEAVGVEGSSVYLKQGEKLKLLDLLYALMLESANDAATAIAIHLAGSVEAFAERMNEKAADLGMKNSHFVNPHGLNDEAHYASAKDLSVLMAYAMKNPVFAQLVGTKTHTIPALEQNQRFLSNHNRLLRSDSRCVGGKTGFTKAAGRCLVTAAEENGKRLICTTLGAPDDWNDHRELFDYGFSLYSQNVVLQSRELSIEIPVVGGEADRVLLTNENAVVLPLRAGETVEKIVELPRFFYAPILEDGKPLGEIAISLDGIELARCPIVAKENVAQKQSKPNFFQRIWNRIKSLF